VLLSVDGLAASYLDDPQAEMPNLRAIAAQGVSAEGMRTVLPSLTWPSHTSLITGAQPARHGVLGNSVWNRRTNRLVVYLGDPVLTKSQAIQVPTLYDLAHQAGFTTASVTWPCSIRAKTLDWTLPVPNSARPQQKFTTPRLEAELAEAGIDLTPLAKWGREKEFFPQRDQLYTKVAQHLLERVQVNLLLLHLITPDGVQHAYGPQTPPAYEAVAEVDKHIGTIWNVLQQPPFAEQSAMFVVSDHGFAPYHKIIQPNALLVELGLVKLDLREKVSERAAWCTSQGGSAFIYVLEEQRREEITAQLVKKLAQLPGVLEVLQPESFADFGVPLPTENSEAPDIILTTGPGFTFREDTTGPIIVDSQGKKGMHGHDPSAKYMHATFVAAGAGIKSGEKLEVVNSVDVAPTIARLLGLDMQTDGRVMEGVLLP